MDKKLTHFDDDGKAVMVDVTEKLPTSRTAAASGVIRVSAEVIRAIEEGTAEKGDVLGVARVAGIMAVKQTSQLIPLCHPLPVSKCGIDFELDRDNNRVKAICTVRVTGRTGVEMEALTGVSTALLTIYDMCKALDKRMELSEIHLDYKSGGKSGTFTR